MILYHIIFIEMTLVYREEKKDVFQPNQNQLGPGYYHISPSVQEEKHKIPFNSSIQRNLFSELQLGVAPGFYEVSNDFIKKQNTSGCTFKSQIQRFRSSMSDVIKQNKPEVILKIGREENNEKKSKNQFNNYAMIKRRKTQQKFNKLKTFPSIPTFKQSFGYQMNQYDELILNQNPREIMSKLDQYRNNSLKKKQPRGYCWSKSKIHRQSFCKSKSQLVQPVSHDVKPKWESKVFTYKVQNKINSDDRKFALLKLRHQQQFSNYYDKNQQKKYFQTKVIDSEIGPAYYQINCNSNKQTNEKQECFGSKVQRFHENPKQPLIQTKTSQNFRKQEQKSNQNKVSTNFSKVDRFKIIGKNHHNPGPGTYNSSKQNYQQSNGHMFNKGERFNEQKLKQGTNQNPGPGEYSVNDRKSSSFHKFRTEKKTRRGDLLKSQFNKNDCFKHTFMISSDDPHQSKEKISQRDVVNKFQYSRIKDLFGLESIKKAKQQISQKINTNENKNIINDKDQKDLHRMVKIMSKKKDETPKNSRQQSGLGPGSYNLELKYGKQTFNVSYS